MFRSVSNDSKLNLTAANAQGHRCIKCPHLECHKNGSFFASFDNRDQVKVVHQEDDEPDDPVSECLSPRVKVNGNIVNTFHFAFVLLIIFYFLFLF